MPARAEGFNIPSPDEPPPYLKSRSIEGILRRGKATDTMTSSPNENSTAVRQENTSVTVSADSSELLGTWALRQQGLRVKIKLGLLVGLLVLHVVISLIAIAPGYLLIDEACYHWMTRDFTPHR